MLEERVEEMIEGTAASEQEAVLGRGAKDRGIAEVARVGVRAAGGAKVQRRAVADEDVELNCQQHANAEANNAQGHEDVRLSTQQFTRGRQQMSIEIQIQVQPKIGVGMEIEIGRKTQEKGIDAEKRALEKPEKGKAEEQEKVGVVLDSQAAAREGAVVVHEVNTAAAHRAVTRARGLGDSSTRRTGAHYRCGVTGVVLEKTTQCH